MNGIEAGFDANNPKSGRVMEKVRGKKEEFMRQAGRNNQGLFDLIMYAIVKEDWPKCRAQETQMRNR